MDTLNMTIDTDGVAVVLLEARDRASNTITHAMVAELDAVLASASGDPAVKGLIIGSAKQDGFCSGADLDEVGALMAGARYEEAFELASALNRVLRGLETCGKPVAAAIEGDALGGGLEICLAAGHRMVRDDPRIRLGLPESTLGLMPGAGGTQRLPRLIGAAAALKMLLQGRPMSPRDALAAGLVDELVEGDVLQAARAWILSAPAAGAPWERRGFEAPGGGPYSASGFTTFMMAAALLRKESYGLYPAQINILKSVYEGLQLPIDAALRVETRYFIETLRTREASAMVRTLFLSPRELRKGASRPKDPAPFDIRSAAVIGAGMMGAGIAHAHARCGLPTVLVDVDQDALGRGLEHNRRLFERLVKRGSMSEPAAQAALASIHPTCDYAELGECDIVIEAVFEDRELKARVIGAAEAQLRDTAVLGSNTSTLPISGLAASAARPANFIGIHFFSPVDRMNLVEIIVGAQTSEDTLAKAFDYVRRLGKTPIVVRDSRGFYTSRCFSTYVSEGIELLAEGVAPAIIENLGRACGMPRGPLEMNDDVALDLSHRILQQTKADLGEEAVAGPVEAITRMLVVDFGRYGRKNGRGFYDYPEDGRPKRLWPGLAELAPVRMAAAGPEVADAIRARLLYRQALEAARCLEEGVVSNPRDADVGATLAWGFAPWTGGPLSMIDSVGADRFVDRCDAFAEQLGARFVPPPALRQMAASGERYYPRPR